MNIDKGNKRIHSMINPNKITFIPRLMNTIEEKYVDLKK